MYKEFNVCVTFIPRCVSTGVREWKRAKGGTPRTCPWGVRLRGDGVSGGLCLRSGACPGDDSVHLL